jgi:DNA-binding NarL/FixJ family response regulator
LPKKKLSEHEIEEILTFADKGLTYREIAKKVQRSLSTIHNYILLDTEQREIEH